MPRPRLVSKPRFIGFEVEEEVYELLRKVAYEKRATISMVAREILYTGLKSIGILSAEKTQPPDNRMIEAQDPRETDLIVKDEIEEFSEKLNELELKIDAVGGSFLKLLDNMNRKTLNRSDIRSYLQDDREYLKLINQIHMLEDEIRKATSKYYRMKRNAGREDLTQIERKLYNIRWKHRELKNHINKLNATIKMGVEVISK